MTTSSDITNEAHAGSGEAWHTLTVNEVASRLGTDLDRGLAATEAAARLERFGPNALAAIEGRSVSEILIAQFRSLIVGLLLAATALAFVMGETIEGAAVLVVILLNAAFGFFTEWKAEQALSALQKQAVPRAHVIRDGEEREVASADLVPGDLVVLAAGARVPADGRVIESARLQVEEAALTGESLPVSKSPDPIEDRDAPLGDRHGMAFMGTTITDGRGKLLVTGTGGRTEIGQIGTLIQEAGTRSTPLEDKLDRLGRALVGLVLGLCAVIVTAGWFRGEAFLKMLEIGISLAIAAVPEGLPAVATMTLALGMQRMARKGALVRRLPAVEALGSVTVICTDKTGTLTRNEMTVSTLVLGSRRLTVTGTGYAPEGEFLGPDRSRIEPKADPQLELALRIGLLCNDARMDRSDGKEQVLGDPTEGALLVAAEKAGLHPGELHGKFPRLDEVPFDSHAKRMITVHRTEGAGPVAFVKGAPGSLLDASVSVRDGDRVEPLSPEVASHYNAMNETLAGEALRVLGLAYRELPENYDPADLDRDLVFVGLVGMIDPLRDEAAEAVATCRGAGIRTVMITGDQPATAAEIGRQLGIDRSPAGQTLAPVHAREIENLDDAGLEEIASRASVFARVSPRHKLRLVEALQRRGEIVSMTGDGVNDAPALKTADIGVAMGIKGTEVAKEASSMIITDDNFATIVVAVEQGRIIYANILKFVHFLFSCNFAEILTVFAAIMIGWPLPLGALQILWLNVITDVFPAMALALEPSAPEMMKRPPRDPRAGLLTRKFLAQVIWQGLLLAAVTLIVFRIGLNKYGEDGEGLLLAETMAFVTLALAQVFHAFNVRSQLRSIFHSNLFKNGWLWGALVVCVFLQVLAVTVPLLQKVLDTRPMSAEDWTTVLLFALLPIAVVEAVKWVGRRFPDQFGSVTRQELAGE